MGFGGMQKAQDITGAKAGTGHLIGNFPGMKNVALAALVNPQPSFSYPQGALPQPDGAVPGT